MISSRLSQPLGQRGNVKLTAHKKIGKDQEDKDKSACKALFSLNGQILQIPQLLYIFSYLLIIIDSL